MKEAVAIDSLREMRFLTGVEMRVLLGISPGTLHRLTFQKVNPLPSKKFGRLRRYPSNDVKAWMKGLGK